ncbi:flavodoxin [Dethiosulfovibrio peptidovorans DSM 11002]|uniref:Flavodoxin n=1 Tax=Dethiosulfovibrio peptidovorans DSM 11002 TaxID=469381 RepID=D2Z7R3_9BACT|nr:flavodoxin [Dethiosulfovibrio peptidovorans]EFC91510.1 flavodoxin [Dethiosulfovibrio peptidovorans DSM 11002]
MATISVLYGSTTGATKAVAEKIAKDLGADLFDVASAGDEAFTGYDVIILGSSTWGMGELQDDWNDYLPKLEQADLSGKKVAFFGTGDQEGFGDTFVDALGLLHDAIADKGIQVIGKRSTDGYSGGELAIRDGEFLGLAIDETNQPELTEGRIVSWLDQLRTEMR